MFSNLFTKFEQIIAPFPEEQNNVTDKQEINQQSSNQEGESIKSINQSEKQIEDDDEEDDMDSKIRRHIMQRAMELQQESSSNSSFFSSIMPSFTSSNVEVDLEILTSNRTSSVETNDSFSNLTEIPLDESDFSESEVPSTGKSNISISKETLNKLPLVSTLTSSINLFQNKFSEISKPIQSVEPNYELNNSSDAVETNNLPQMNNLTSSEENKSNSLSNRANRYINLYNSNDFHNYENYNSSIESNSHVLVDSSSKSESNFSNQFQSSENINTHNINEEIIPRNIDFQKDNTDEPEKDNTELSHFQLDESLNIDLDVQEQSNIISDNIAIPSEVDFDPIMKTEQLEGFHELEHINNNDSDNFEHNLQSSPLHSYPFANPQLTTSPTTSLPSTPPHPYMQSPTIDNNIKTIKHENIVFQFSPGPEVEGILKNKYMKQLETHLSSLENENFELRNSIDDLNKSIKENGQAKGIDNINNQTDLINQISDLKQSLSIEKEKNLKYDDLYKLNEDLKKKLQESDELQAILTQQMNKSLEVKENQINNLNITIKKYENEISLLNNSVNASQNNFNNDLSYKKLIEVVREIFDISSNSLNLDIFLSQEKYKDLENSKLFLTLLQIVITNSNKLKEEVHSLTKKNEQEIENNIKNKQIFDSEIFKLKKNLSDIKMDLGKKESEINNLNVIIQQLRAVRKNKIEEDNLNSSNLNELQQKYNELKKDHERILLENEDYHNNNKILANDLNLLEHDKKILAEKFNLLNNELTQLKSENNNLKNENFNFKTEISFLKKEASGYTSSYNQLENEKKMLRNELTIKEEELNNYVQSLSLIENDYKLQIQNLKSKLMSKEEEKQKTMNEEFKIKIEELEEKNKNLVDENNYLNLVIKKNEIYFEKEKKNYEVQLNMSLNKLKNASSDLINREIISDLFVKYIEKKRDREILRLISKVLNFNDEQLIKVGLKVAPSNPISNFLKNFIGAGEDNNNNNKVSIYLNIFMLVCFFFFQYI